MRYKKVTLSELAKHAGVSATTVSMILSGRQGTSFGKETTEKVLRIAHEMGYVPSQKHTAIRQGIKTVIIACPNISNQYYSRIAQAIQQEAIANSFSTLIFTHYRDLKKETECIHLAQHIGAAGIIFATMPNNVQLLEQIKDSIGDRDNRVGLDTIELNDYGAGELLASHLISLGHKHVAFISTTLGESFAMRQRRLQGLRDVMTTKCPEGKIEIFSNKVTPEKELGDIDVEYNIGYKLTTECLEEKGEVTAFVAVNDSVAAGVIDAIRAKGFRVPQDYSVCGCDNVMTSRYEFVSLTTVDHQLEEKGRYAFHILQKRIEKLGSGRITHVEYPNRLMERRSTGRARKGVIPPTPKGSTMKSWW